jgi:hypothetical protein
MPPIRFGALSGCTSISGIAGETVLLYPVVAGHSFAGGTIERVAGLRVTAQGERGLDAILWTSMRFGSAVRRQEIESTLTTFTAEHDGRRH